MKIADGKKLKAKVLTYPSCGVILKFFAKADGSVLIELSGNLRLREVRFTPKELIGVLATV